MSAELRETPGYHYTPATGDGQGPILPVEGKKNILITSALPYVNNVPHLGNIIGSVLSADVYARFCRLRDYNTLFICGTDEYGTATETKAQNEGISPKELCDKFHSIHSKVYEWFDISFDHFGRTSTRIQTKITQDIFNKCEKNGYICCDAVSQLYCEKCERFLADRYVAGTCPLCGYDDAKGDQCDKCSQLINAVELINPKCTTCSSKPIVKSSNHLFIDLPAVSEKLEAFVNANQSKWSDNSVAETHNWLKKGLKPRCITRDLKWGTPVPKEGYTDKVFYVWFDAPIGYISITANYTEDWEKWWKNSNVELVQFMGKDNIAFHTVIFPSTLIATEDNYTLLSRISTTEYLNYEGTKFSKTRGIGVFGDQAIETGIPSEVWRYYLIYNRPEQNDAMFLWEDFASKTNVELPNAVGNLVQRSLAFIKSKLDGKVPQASDLTELETQLETDINNEISNYIQLLDNQSIKEALKVAMNVSYIGNKYMQTTKPWDLLKTDPVRCGTVLAVNVHIINLISVLFEPFMPSFSRKVNAQLNMPFATKALAESTFNGWNLSEYLRGEDVSNSGFCVPAGHAIGEPQPIFKKIDASQIEELRKKYAGKQNTANTGAEFPLNIIAGTIEEVEPHPTNSRCYVLKVNTGDDKPRQIVSGLVASVSSEELLDKQVLILTNLKFGKFGGVLSEGMLLTSIHVSGNDSKAAPLVIESIVPNGSKVVPEGCKLAPVKVFDVKKKLAELQLTVNAEHKATFGGIEWKVQDVPVIAPNVPEGSRIC